MASPSAEAYRLQQAALGKALALRASRESRNWLTDPGDVWAGFWSLVDRLIEMVTQSRSISHQQALQFYELSRQLANAPGVAPQVDEPPFPTNPFIASLIWAGPRYAQTLIGAGKTENLNEVVGNSVGRAVLKHTLNAGRTTLVQAVRRDEDALGWARITDTDPCEFCAMLASRGAVYKTARSAGQLNKWHDGCSCSIVPVFKD